MTKTRKEFKRMTGGKNRMASVPDDKEILELAKQVQLRGWSIMHQILKEYYINQLKGETYDKR
tara:strand:- start:418 stop:606 length:189 start_codon:yes stop_codon:yes gene_type:complete